MRGMVHENDKDKGTIYAQDEVGNSCIAMSRHCSAFGKGGIGTTPKVDDLTRGCAPRPDVKKWSTFVATRCAYAQGSPTCARNGARRNTGHTQGQNGTRRRRRVATGKRGGKYWHSSTYEWRISTLHRERECPSTEYLCAQTELTRKSLHQQKTAMHHHTENESSLLSCLVLSSLVFSSLVLSLLFRLLFTLSLSYFSLSVSVSVWCCGRVVLWCVVLWCGVCAVWCVVCDTLKNPVCPLNTETCVRSKRPRVYRHTTRRHVSTCVRVVCRYTRGCYERTHGDVFHR